MNDGASNRPSNRPSVLIVEDERIVAKDLQQTLLAMGYDAFGIASSADECLSLVAERCPDVVLMDIRLKGQRDGIEAAGLLRAQFGVPIVFLTAHADDATIERAKRMEPAGYLMKPVKAGELRSVIEVALYKHAMDKRLRERERWFSTTLRSIGDAVVTVDLEGIVTFMNPAAEALLGEPASVAVGRPVRDIIRLLDPAQPSSPLDQVLEEHRNLVIHEAPVHHPIAPRLISDSATMVVDDNEVLGAVMVFRDITEQKMLQKQLEVSDRLTSLGTMAAGVAHEINSPLSIVLANTSFVLDELRSQRADAQAAGRETHPFDGTIRAQIETESAVERIAKIVSSLQAFARPAQPSGGAASVHKAAVWAVRSTVAEFTSRATVDVDIPAELPPVRLDETRLGQVLVNLLVNAAHAIAPGHSARNRVSIRARDAESSVVIEVSDSGSGMAPDLLRRVFEPFFTTKPVGVGTGLGLSICHGIVRSVSGQLDVESTPGVGTTFRITIPKAETAEVTVDRPAVSARRGRILLIDDDAGFLKALCRILSDHETVAVQDARDALELLAREPFDIIFSDIMMPAMSGPEFYEQLLSVQPEAAGRVVFLTGGALSNHTRDFLGAIANTCLEKPISVAELRAFVAQLLARS